MYRCTDRTNKLKQARNFDLGRLKKPHQGVFAELLHLLHRSILTIEGFYLENFHKMENTWFRSQVMLTLVIFRAASKMSSAL